MHVLVLLITTLMDSIMCFVVSTTFVASMRLQRKSLSKKKGRQLQKGEHKGAIRIDTPPPSVDFGESSIFRR